MASRLQRCRLPRCVTHYSSISHLTLHLHSLASWPILPITAVGENCLQRVASELFVCDAATTTTAHVTCQCHALAAFRKGLRSSSCSLVCGLLIVHMLILLVVDIDM